jgi:hypothetical protein
LEVWYRLEGYEMKLGVSINAFDGVELLYHSINQIRQYVDFISVVWQEKDWYGTNNIKSEDLDILINLKQKNIIDNLNLYRPEKYAVNSIQAKQLEIEKRNIGKNICKEFGMNYFMTMDVDEFYVSEQFEKAKQYIIDNNIDYSYCFIQNYFKFPIYKVKEISNSCVSFISKLTDRKLGTNNLSALHIDPTRGYIIDQLNDKLHVFDKDNLLMHHMSTVRTDLKLKYQCSSMANIDRTKIDTIVDNVKKINDNNLQVEYLTKHETLKSNLVKCDNQFNIPLELF